MKAKGELKIWIAMAVFMALISISVFVGSASANTIYVPDNYAKIQWAVDNATDGDTIIVRDGIYIENVNVNTPYLTIQSENGSDSTIVQAENHDDHVFEVTADYVNISGFTVEGATYKAGIYLYYADNYCNISNNVALNNKYGLYLYKSSNNTITNNNASNNIYFGIYLYCSCSNIITNNNISNNYDYGIWLHWSDSNTLRNNKASDNGYYGIYLDLSCSNTIRNNNASNNGRYGIYLDHSCSNTITNSTALNNNWYGIYLHDSSYNNILLHNNASNNNRGICLGRRSNNNIISDSTFSSNEYGIVLQFSYNNKIYLNNFIKNTDNVYSDEDSTNIWNSTSQILYTYNGSEFENYLGNYWDDYSDTDANGDGIWDNHRPIDSDCDYHPLVEPFENYGLEEEEKWSFAIITDMHIGRGYPDYGGSGYDDGNTGQDYYLTERLKKAVEWINENKSEYNIKFVIVLGDISDSGEYSELKKAKDILDKLNVPYVPVIGNHEIWPYTDGDENASVSYFMRVFKYHFENLTKDPKFNLRLQSEIPLDPTPEYFVNYNFTYKGVNFVVLDFNSRMAAPGGLPGTMAYAANIPETINWLDESLSEHGGEPVIIISHHPFTYSPTSSFLRPDLHQIKNIIVNSGAKVLANFAGHIHGFDTAGFPYLTGDRFMDANTEYTDMNIFSAITTEALMVGSNEERQKGVKGIIRIVNVDGESIEYEAEKAEGEFSALNPRFTYSPEDISVAQWIKFKAHTFTKREISSYEWNLGWDRDEGGNIITVSKSGEEVVYAYRVVGPRTITLTVIDNEGVNENITGSISVSAVFKEAHCICGVKEGLEAVLPEKREDATESAQNTPERVAIFRQHSEEKPIAEFIVHFDNATEDIDLSNITADVNLTARKSVIYMSSWPDEIEESKILYIPSTGKGAVYICKNATSLEEVSIENADVVINVGETKDGMTVVTTLYNDIEYYVVFNVTGTGGGEFTPIENIFDTGEPANPYPSIMGIHNGTIKPNQTMEVQKLYTYPCLGTGGHTEYAMIWNETIGDCVVAEWNGYIGDYHNISFSKTLTLGEGMIYNYTIRTGSYPQIHHTDELEVASGTGTITCDKFIDANGKVYYDWIPAIRLA